MAENKVELIVTEAYLGNRADQTISCLLPDISRSKIKQWIDQGYILINDELINPKKKVLTGDRITVFIQNDDKNLQFLPEDIDFHIIYSDNDIAVINKPPGLVVHPADGNWTGTLLNGILKKFPLNKFLPRAGIVHRLDKDTSGLLVIALNDLAQQSLIYQLQNKTVYREYRAIVWGDIYCSGKISEPIGRHPKNRIKMSVNKINGKDAVTNYEPIENFTYHSYIKCILETGRTHQIRVHMNHNKTPIVGDPIYGYKKIFPFKKNINKDFVDKLLQFPRQALHAKKLGLIHPASNKQMVWDIKLPDDFLDLLETIHDYSSVNKNNKLSRFNQHHFDDKDFD
jgi:23S rRNA pseudouridine1911/1915/1917 synthase